MECWFSLLLLLGALAMGPGWGALMESLVSQGEGSTSVTEETQNTTDDSSSRDGSSSAQNSSCASENSTSPLKELFLLLKVEGFLTRDPVLEICGNGHCLLTNARAKPKGLYFHQEEQHI